MKKIFFVLLLALPSCFINAQLVIDNSTQTPQELAQNVLLGQGINISNIKFNNSAVSAIAINDQIAQFSNGKTTNIGIEKGIILSTGNALIGKGPNDQIQATLPTSNSFLGDNDLKILSNNQAIKSVAILEFDFVPSGNKLNFNFVFASEEYPEYANDNYNDHFGFFLSGPGIAGPFSRNASNIALIPNTTLPVSINNLNNGKLNTGNCENCTYYVDNTGGTTIQYDGFTKVIGATAAVQCGQTYHIKLAIANVEDDNFDSAVFIEGASFSASDINLGADLNLCSVNKHKLDTGLDASIVHQWTVDGQIISNESGPSITIDQSGTYAVKATPLGGCPSSDEIKVGFNTAQKPTISCGTKTINSLQFNWLSIPTITNYSISYKIGSNSEIIVGDVGNVNFYTVTNILQGETAEIKVTPIGGNPADCFVVNAMSCILDNCLVSPTITLNQGTTSQQICENAALTDIIFTVGGGATNASITAGSLPAGVSASLVGNQFTIKGTPTATGIFNYTITTSGGCGANASISGSITVNQKINPAFTTTTSICIGETIAALPLLSNNSISGKWTPALNNLATTEYTFTPDVGQCANTTKLTITVNSAAISPTFNTINPICAGETIAVLPTISNNSISGKWTPALNNLATTEYTFTPDVGQCANTTKLTITVNPKITPIFNAVNPICAGETIAVLPTISNNSISGKWTPALNNLATTEYTFTPDIGQCAAVTKLTITVNPKITPIFNAVNPICAGETIAVLPTISNNTISGKWTPALDNLKTTEYTFTPNIGQCAGVTKLTITVNSKTTPMFNAVNPICAGETIAALPTISNNSISGKWTPALNNLATTEYTFTPDVGQCAAATKLTITVNSKTTPIFNAVAPICTGETIAALPTTSNNSISGKWTPALNNLATTEYTFTPDIGLCANPAKLTITINPKVIPLFNVGAPICAGETIAVLPTISNNSISGKWTPALNNLKTTEYTFTPDIGQCAAVTKLTITVNSKSTPIFNAVNPICAGETIAVLPTTSNNSISGKWTPALNNLKTTEYTFTPNIGHCANSTKLTIRVNPKPTPSLLDGMICKDKTTNAIIKSYILDSNLNPTDYNFEWFLDGKTIINATRNTLEPIEKGVYSVIATNKITKCSSAQIEATISENLIDAASIKIEQTNSFSNAATITIAIIPATGIYEYKLDNGTFQTASVFSEVAAGSHIINIVDAIGCYNVSKEIVVLGFPKFFTPNGDGINDTWNIIGFTARYNPMVYIFDRFGKLLKQISSNNTGWDGTYNGHPMPSDDYWFTVQFLEDGIPKEFRSHFSLKR